MTKAMKAVTGSLKVDLAQFRAMEAFAMFASDLDAASRQQLDRGQRLMALLKQPAYNPYPVEEMTVSLWLGTGSTARPGAHRGRAPLRAGVPRLPAPEPRRHAVGDPRVAEVRRRHRAGAGLPRTTPSWTSSRPPRWLDQGRAEEHEALEDEDVEQEQIVKQKRG